MPKWSEIVSRVIPWLDMGRSGDMGKLLDEAAACTAEQEALAPIIAAQSDYLVERGKINGFTRQLQTGFERKLSGE